MDGVLMKSAWARLQEFICKATNTQYPAQKYSFNWDVASGNASLKMLGNTYRYTALSEAAGREGCARDALMKGVLSKILAEANPIHGRMAELTKTASAYSNVNRLPSMSDLFPGEGNLDGGPQAGHHTMPAPHAYNGPPPNIPSLLLPAPETAKERLQVFIADIFGHSSPLFEQIDFAQARAGNAPWSITLCNREYTSQYIYQEKEHGQEAAVRVALEKGALSVLLAQHAPQPQYHAGAIDLIAKFSQTAGLYTLPPPIGQVSGGRTPVPAQPGYGTPTYVAMAHGGASPYHGAVSLPPASPYHMSLVPTSPYHGGYGSDAMYASASGYGSSREKRGRSSSRRRSSRSGSKRRSSSKRSKNRRRRSRSFSSTGSSVSSRSQSPAGSHSDREKHRSSKRSRSRRKTEHRSKSRRRGQSRRHREKEKDDAAIASDEPASATSRLVEHDTQSHGFGAENAQRPAAVGHYTNGHEHTGTISAELGTSLFIILDYLLKPSNSNEKVTTMQDDTTFRCKEESPEPFSSGPVHSVQRSITPDPESAIASLMQNLDPLILEKLRLAKTTCAIAPGVDQIRSAIQFDALRGKHSKMGGEELVLVPRAWLEESMELLQGTCQNF